jgi:hypothetical protein
VSWHACQKTEEQVGIPSVTMKIHTQLIGSHFVVSTKQFQLFVWSKNKDWKIKEQYLMQKHRVKQQNLLKALHKLSPIPV